MDSQDLDFADATTAPVPPDEPNFAAAMSPKKRGRPKKIPQPTPAAIPRTLSYNEDIDRMENIDISLLGINEQDIKPLEDIDSKQKLSLQELRFLSIYFLVPREKGKNRMTINRAMLSAGYGQFGERMRYTIARKIIQRYEQAAPDAAKIFRELGFGPVRTVMGIIDHCENSPPTVSLNALKLAAQCQGMIDKQEDHGQGINIVINTSSAPQLPGVTCPAPDGPVQIVIAGAQGQDQAPAPPRKPLQIIR